MYTAGLPTAVAERFAEDVAQTAGRLAGEFGGVEDMAVCLASPEVEIDVGDLVPFGRRLHSAVFGPEGVLLIRTIQIGFVDDAIAYGLAELAAWRTATELGLEDGYPEPLASTIANWYLARANKRLDRFHAVLLVSLFLDDPNPERRTLADATDWTAGSQQNPLLFDPQFIESPMADFIEFAVTQRGIGVLRQPEQSVWGPLENEWRIAMRDELLGDAKGSNGWPWGAAIVSVFLVLAAAMGWGRRREKKRAAGRRSAVAPPETDLFESRFS